MVTKRPDKLASSIRSRKATQASTIRSRKASQGSRSCFFTFTNQEICFYRPPDEGPKWGILVASVRTRPFQLGSLLLLECPAASVGRERCGTSAFQLGSLLPLECPAASVRTRAIQVGDPSGILVAYQQGGFPSSLPILCLKFSPEF